MIKYGWIWGKLPQIIGSFSPKCWIFWFLWIFWNQSKISDAKLRGVSVWLYQPNVFLRFQGGKRRHSESKGCLQIPSCNLSSAIDGGFQSMGVPPSHHPFIDGFSMTQTIHFGVPPCMEPMVHQIFGETFDCTPSSTAYAYTAYNIWI